MGWRAYGAERGTAALAADGFEKVELMVPLRALKAAGATVDVVSLPRGRIRDPGDDDGLLLPGGFINPDLLRQPAPARQDMAAFVRGMLDAFAKTSPEPATTASRRESDGQREAPVPAAQR